MGQEGSCCGKSDTVDSHTSAIEKKPGGQIDSLYKIV